MKAKFSDIELAFEVVSGGSPYEAEVVLDLETGRTYYRSELSDVDEYPEDVDDPKYVSIPHKNDLDLGRNLVFDFVAQALPDQLNQVDRIFRKQGAYSRYKSLLQRHGKLEEWYRFEEAETEKALREWCEIKGIELEG